VNAYADLDAANKDLQTKLDDYNDKVQQLDALVKQKGLNDYKASYDKSVENYLDEVKTSATEATGSISYVDKDGVKQTWSKGAGGKEEFINNMVNDLRAQLNGLESSGSVTKVASSVTVDKLPPKDNDGNPLKGDAPTAPVTSIDKAAATADKIANQRDKMAGTQAQWSYDMANKLSKALNGIVNDMKGPQLLTGSDIGTNANGDMVSTASGQNGISFTAANSGSRGQIAGFTVAVRDSEGNLKKSVNASLDAFEETVRGVDASEDNAINLQVGAKANQAITVGLTDMRAEALGLKGSDGTKLNISTREKANAAVNVLDNALAKALDQQTTIGSIESRLEYTSSNLTTASENVQASESTIRDADMAREMTEYTKNNVLLQAAQSMLSQANQNSSSVLSLLQ
jgi:flagellin-like hook-associated protein FlgL